ncbi:thioesterase domain-containing protein [Streptomyces sp. Tue 6430]|nr:thioesterase domain-containing protein [Streptomyces sp. Tue 6430]
MNAVPRTAAAAAPRTTTTPSRPVADRSIARLRPAEDPGLRLICFPHVGAGATAFRPWLEHLPPEVDLCAIRPPGRESRIREALLTDGRSLLDEVEPHLAPLLDVPFAVVGHCSGACWPTSSHGGCTQPAVPCRSSWWSPHPRGRASASSRTRRCTDCPTASCSRGSSPTAAWRNRSWRTPT